MIILKNEESKFNLRTLNWLQDAIVFPSCAIPKEARCPS